MSKLKMQDLRQGGERREGSGMGERINEWMKA